MKLNTARLVIRLFEADDFTDYYNYIMEPYLQEMLGLHDVSDRNSALLTFNWLMENRRFLALVLDGTAIGHICIHPMYADALGSDTRFDGKNGASLSFAIAKAYRRQGLMEEALRAVIAQLFDEGTDYLDCEYITQNTPSGALQEKLGFRFYKEERFGDITLITGILEKRDGHC